MSTPEPFPNGRPQVDLLQNLSFIRQASTYLQAIGLASTNERFSIGWGRKGEVVGETSRAGAQRVGKQNNSRNGKVKGKGKKQVHVEEPVGGMNNQAGEQESHSRRKRKTVVGGDIQAASRRANKASRYITQHSMLKVDPAFKRMVCKGCYTTLIPGLTARVRVKASRSHFNKMNATCTTCQTIQSIPAPPQPLPSPEPINPAHRPSTEPPLPPSDSPLGTPPLNSPKSSKPLHGPVRTIRLSKHIRPTPFWQKDEHTTWLSTYTHNHNQYAGKTAGPGKGQKGAVEGKGQGKGKGNGAGGADGGEGKGKQQKQKKGKEKQERDGETGSQADERHSAGGDAAMAAVEQNSREKRKAIGGGKGGLDQPEDSDEKARKGASGGMEAGAGMDGSGAERETHERDEQRRLADVAGAVDGAQDRAEVGAKAGPARAMDIMEGDDEEAMMNAM